MSQVPPIQGIIDVRAALDAALDMDQSEAESEEVWRARLESIYEGLLRANPNYLSLSFVLTQNEPEGRQVVRVERSKSDVAFVRRVPKSRLGAFMAPQVLETTLTLPPGEVSLSLYRPASSAQAAPTLMTTVPVYDENRGSLFGLVMIESNLTEFISHFLRTLGQHHAHIFVTDGEGVVWVVSDPVEGVSAEEGETPVNVTKLIPNVGEFFQQADSHKLMDRSLGILAERVQLDKANPETQVGLVMQVDNK